MSIINTASALHVTNGFGSFQINVFRDRNTGIEHILLTKGQVSESSSVLCRIASECLTGMVLDSADCDCLQQLHFGMSMIENSGKGVLILLRQEGRGHGLTTKIQALNNKNKGYDTFSAVEQLGLPSDCRTYEVAAEMLSSLEIKSIRLITSNPDKVNKLNELNIIIEEVKPTPRFITSRNEKHILAKIARGHQFLEGNFYVK